MLEQLKALSPSLAITVGFAVLLVVALIGHLIAQFVLLRVVRRVTRQTVVTWDDALVQHKVFRRAAQVVPALVLFLGTPFVPHIPVSITTLLRNVAMGYMVLMVTAAIAASLAAVNTVYTSMPAVRDRPIKGFVQVGQLIVYLLGGVMVIASVVDKSPLLLLSGLGAMGAILILVFKDTILGFVASIQLAAQDMVRVGDWIEMSQYGADGAITDVALHTVKVQNWDKSVTMIPTHVLIQESFRNWRGMSEAGGRRIMRSVALDLSSVRFLSEDEVARFTRFSLLKDYIENKQKELAEYNRALQDITDVDVNRRRLTNIGTFRAYVYNYLRYHPNIHREMVMMVRQLAAGAEGVPIQVYAFCNDTRWDVFEGVQADIFDHMLAIVPEFGLRLYQNPTGADLQHAIAARRDESKPSKPVTESAR